MILRKQEFLWFQIDVQSFIWWITFQSWSWHANQSLNHNNLCVVGKEHCSSYPCSPIEQRIVSAFSAFRRVRAARWNLGQIGDNHWSLTEVKFNPSNKELGGQHANGRCVYTQQVQVHRHGFVSWSLQSLGLQSLLDLTRLLTNLKAK